MKKGAQDGRIRLLSFVVILAALLIIGRLYYLQIINGEEFQDMAERQYTRTSVSSSNLDRGSLYFSSKDDEAVFAAILKSGYELSVNPSMINNPEDVYNFLSGVMDIDEEVFLSKATKENDIYEEITDKLDEDTATKIKALNIAGVNLQQEKWRFYPKNKLASNVLGFVGYRDEANPLVGLYGLERYYNDVLERSSKDLYKNFFAEIFLNLKGSLEGKEGKGDIVTSIEPTVAGELEKELAKIQILWQSDLTGGVIMDPTTGEIYAMSVIPTFDPNYPRLESSNRIFANPIIEDVYEMGSIMKPLSIASALDTGAVTAKTTYNDAGSIVLNSSTIRNFDGKARGPGTDVQRVLSESLNVGMAFVTSKIGNKKLAEYFKNLGFGEETGIDLPGEVHGLIGNLDSPRDVEYATASFGQGIAVTPIAMVRALSALGNGGILPNPHIGKRIERKGTPPKIISYKEGPRIFKEETSEEITRMLVRVVDEALLGGTVKMPRYSIAAKTGTAQMAKVDGRGYYDDRYLHSFFGYFPAYDPKFIIFLFTVYPKGASFASHTLTYPFIDLTKFLISYYNIPPDR